MTSKQEEAYSVGLQPSMSSSAQLIECAFAYGKEFDHIGASEPARYGSCFHELLAAKITHDVRARRGVIELLRPLISTIAKKWDVADKRDELDAHVPLAYAELQRWLGRNEYKIDFHKMREDGGLLLIEQGVALTPLMGGRSIPPHDESHRYHGLVLGEQPGTLDLAIVPRTFARVPGTQVYRPNRAKKVDPILVLDHKTGDAEDFSRPLEKAQLLSLAAGVMRWVGAGEAIVGVLHARRRGLPKVYTEKVRLSELRSYETRIKTGLSRIGDGSMRPGPWCNRCQARSICPAQDAELLSKAGDVLTGLTAAGGALSKEGLTANDVALARVTPGVLSKARKLGLLYEVIVKAEALAKRGRAEIKNEIVGDADLLPELSNGYLTVREYEKENLSKKGITDAYGKVAGERLLQKLRRDGAIGVTKVQSLWPEKERGR